MFKQFMQPKRFMVMALTLLFGYVVVTSEISIEQFLMVYSIVIAFYFGNKEDENK